MPAYFTEGYFVEKTAWHKLGEVLDAAPNEELLRAKYPEPEGLGERQIAFEHDPVDPTQIKEALLVPKDPVLTGDMLEDARVAFDRRNRPIIEFTWNREGARIFGEFTGNVRSTPSPCTMRRTVNIARMPSPRLLITTPPKTCTRSFIGVLAQRLVRKVCAACKKPTTLNEEVLRELQLDPAEAAGASFMEGEGCVDCNNTGYRGRMAVHEVMMMSEEIERMTVERRSSEEIGRMSQEQGMMTLRQDGVMKKPKNRRRWNAA